MGSKTFKRGISFFIGILCCQILFSQKQANNWLFGNFGLEFLENSVVVKTDYPSHENRGEGIISDANGNLLFYTDGFNVWDRSHNMMPNGDSITLKHGSHSVQISLVVPKPHSGSLYYIFTIDPWNGQEGSGLYYSVVDMALNQGMGDVILKNKKIMDVCSNKITAVYHRNFSDVWVVANKHTSNNYYAFLVSASGISDPVISEVGKASNFTFDGQMKASPDGRWIACTYEYYGGESFALMDFDNSTGKLSNPMSFKLPISYRGGDGIEFSPDGVRLYVYQFGSSGEAGMYQFNLSDPGYEAINKSRVSLGGAIYNSFNEMQLAPNGKIYISKGGGGGGTEHLGVINYPNESGKACNLVENGLYLNGASSFVTRPPVFIQNYFFRTSFIFDNNCQASPIQFRVSNAHRLDSVKWTFGNGASSRLLNPVIQYEQAGTYTVTLYAFYPDRIDTIVKLISINPFTPIHLGNDTSVCVGHELSSPGKFPAYRWNTGDTTKSIKIVHKGGYKLTVKNSLGCFSSDSVFLDIHDLPVINFPDTMILETRDSIRIDAGAFSSYAWNTGEKTSFIYAKKEAWYSVAVTNSSGCIAARSVFVARNNQPTNDSISGWIVLNPLPTMSPGNDICFINDQTGFIVTESELLCTHDAGKSWEKLTKVVSGRRIAFKNNIGYIVGNRGTIYKSTHQGAGWNKLSFGFTDNLNAITVIHPDTIFITSDNKLFVSDNGGLNWKNFSIEGVDVEDSYFTSSKVGHVACKNGRILRTINGGQSWAVVLTTNTIPSNFFRITFVNEKVGYASKEHSSILKTTDGGSTWKEIASLDATYGIHFLDENIGFIVGEHGAIHKTIDGGKTWQWKGFNGRVYANNLSAVYFLNEEVGFAIGMRGRIIKTINSGVSWAEYSYYGNMAQVQFSSPVTGYATMGNELLKTLDKGKNWTKLGPVKSGTNLSAIDFVSDSIGYALAGGSVGTSMDVNTVFKTVDGGATWALTGSIYGHNDAIYSIDFVDKNTGFASGGYNFTGVFKTSNGGTSWERVGTYSFRQIQFLNSQVGYARETRNAINKIYKTTDGGKTWNINYQIEGYINSFHFINETHGYLVGNQGLMCKTSDGGKTWKRLTVPYGDYIRVKFFSGNIGYILDDYGKLYRTSDAGNIWQNIHNMYAITSIELVDNDIYINGDYGRILKNSYPYDSVSIRLGQVSNPDFRKLTLNGLILSNANDISDVQFQYGLNTKFENSVNATPGFIQSLTSDSVFAEITNLKAETLYYYRIRIKYDGIEYFSNYATFKTLAEFELKINPATAIKPHEAEISGKVISRAGEIRDIQIQYGPDTLFRNHIDLVPDFVAGGSTTDIKTKLLSLRPNTEYFVRIIANYQGKEHYSLVGRFKTIPEISIDFIPPDITGSVVTLQALITPHVDKLENIVFEIGRNRVYSDYSLATPEQIALNEDAYVKATVKNIDPNYIYYYRIRAKMGNKTIYSQENVLKLSGGVIIIPGEIEQKADNSLVLNGLINTQGKNVFDIQFEYGSSSNFENSVMAIPQKINNRIGYNVSATLTGLELFSKYYFRIKATDGVNVYFSDPYSYYLKIKSAVDSVQVFPNPATDHLNVEIPVGVRRIEILDFNGATKEVRVNENFIDISGFPKGLYLIRIHTPSGIATRKFMKQ